MEQCTELMEMMGMEIDTRYTGDARSGNLFRSTIIVLQKTITPDRSRDEILVQLPDYRQALKIDYTTQSLKSSRAFFADVKIGEENVTLIRNSADQTVYDEEQTIVEEIHTLIAQYGAIRNIPLEIIREKGYIYFCYGKKKQYKILKQLSGGKGLVEVRG
jgi:hypothetical protein